MHTSWRDSIKYPNLGVNPEWGSTIEGQGPMGAVVDLASLLVWEIQVSN